MDQVLSLMWPISINCSFVNVTTQTESVPAVGCKYSVTSGSIWPQVHTVTFTVSIFYIESVLRHTAPMFWNRKEGQDVWDDCPPWNMLLVLNSSCLLELKWKMKDAHPSVQCVCERNTLADIKQSDTVPPSWLNLQIRSYFTWVSVSAWSFIILH